MRTKLLRTSRNDTSHAVKYGRRLDSSDSFMNFGESIFSGTPADARRAFIFLRSWDLQVAYVFWR